MDNIIKWNSVRLDISSKMELLVVLLEYNKSEIAILKTSEDGVLHEHLTNT